MQTYGQLPGDTAALVPCIELKGDSASPCGERCERSAAPVQSYNAKFDGSEYPVHGDPGKTMVTVKRVDDHTVEETDHRQGKVTDKIRLAAASDDKTIEVTDNDVIHQQVTNYTLQKQQ